MARTALTTPVTAAGHAPEHVELLLDQEDARTAGGTLLTATHPLVLAAVHLPEHRQARFAAVRVLDPQGTAPEGTYTVVLAQADSTGGFLGGGDVEQAKLLVAAGYMTEQEALPPAVAALPGVEMLDLETISLHAPLDQHVGRGHLGH